MYSHVFSHDDAITCIPFSDGKAAAYESNASLASSVILFLAQNGADVNAKDKYGLTPLHYAAMRGNDDAVQDLLQVPATEIEASIQCINVLRPSHW